MKVAAVTTLLFATLALASPAPAAQPEALAQPVKIAAREANLAHDFNARTLAVRAKPKKPKIGSGGNENSTESAAMSMTPSRVVQLGALSVGVMEVVRLWG